MTFSKWLDTFISEKGIDTSEIFEIATEVNKHIIPIETLIAEMKCANKIEQKKIKDMLVLIDYRNANVKHFLKHLATGLVMNYERRS